MMIVIAVHNRSLGQVNVFTPVCHSVWGGGSWPSSMRHRSHDQGVCIYMGYYCICSTSGRYQSYWNAFLFIRSPLIEVSIPCLSYISV